MMRTICTIIALVVCSSTMVAAQTGQSFCQQGIVNTTGSNTICTNGTFEICSQYPGVAQNSANIIANNMTSITYAGQVSKGDYACSYINAVGSSAWTDPVQVCPPLPNTTCSITADKCATTAPSLVPVETPAPAELYCCDDLRYFMTFWCTGANMLNPETTIYPGSSQITLISYLPALGQVTDCRLCGAEIPSTTTTMATTLATTTAATTLATTTKATTLATTTQATTTQATTLATTSATVAGAGAVVTTSATQALVAATTTAANVEGDSDDTSTTAAAAPAIGAIKPTSTTLAAGAPSSSSADRTTASMITLALAIPLIAAALF